MFIRRLEEKEWEATKEIEYYYESDQYFSLQKNIENGSISFNLILKDFNSLFKKTLDLTIGNLKEIHVNVIEEKEEIIGFIQMGYDEEKKMAQIMNIWVREDKRKEGVGKKLMKSSKGYARYVGAKGVYMKVDARNYPGINFFLKNEFTFTGIKEDLINNEIVIHLSSLF